MSLEYTLWRMVVRGWVVRHDLSFPRRFDERRRESYQALSGNGVLASSTICNGRIM